MNKEYYDDVLRNTACWQNDFRKAANEIMSDSNKRKIPICIPSYKRPDAKFFKLLAKDFDVKNNYPIHVFIRESQINDYENSEYLKDKSWVTIHSFSDQEISDIGLTRAKIVDVMYDLGYETIFMCDDDIMCICPLIPYARQEIYVNKAFRTCNVCETFNMWQLGSEYAWYLFDRCVYTLPLINGFNWLTEMTEEQNSYRLRGLASIVTCINIKRLKENNLNFQTDKIKHHEDFDLEIRALIKGLYPVELPWIGFDTSWNKQDEQLSSYERYSEFQKQMLEDFKDVSFVSARNRGRYPNIGINWNKAKEYLINNKFLNKDMFLKNNYAVNMWQNGKMVEYFK